MQEVMMKIFIRCRGLMNYFGQLREPCDSLGLIEVGLSSNADEECGSKEDDVPYLLWTFQISSHVVNQKGSWSIRSTFQQLCRAGSRDPY